MSTSGNRTRVCRGDFESTDVIVPASLTSRMRSSRPGPNMNPVSVPGRVPAVLQSPWRSFHFGGGPAPTKGPHCSVLELLVPGRVVNTDVLTRQLRLGAAGLRNAIKQLMRSDFSPRDKLVLSSLTSSLFMLFFARSWALRSSTWSSWTSAPSRNKPFGSGVAMGSLARCGSYTPPKRTREEQLPRRWPRGTTKPWAESGIDLVAASELRPPVFTVKMLHVIWAARSAC